MREELLVNHPFDGRGCCPASFGDDRRTIRVGTGQPVDGGFFILMFQDLNALRLEAFRPDLAPGLDSPMFLQVGRQYFVRGILRHRRSPAGRWFPVRPRPALSEPPLERVPTRRYG